MKKILTIFTLLILALPAFSNTGVAFVHGTGNQTNALDDYWKPKFVNSVRQGLPDSRKYIVVNCDFEQFMWTPGAAGCLAEQLTRFISSQSITDLVVVTHSNGGNIIRWIMSNPTWDARYPAIIDRIRRVNALAPSSAGTPLAEAVIEGGVFEQSLGWLLGYVNDGVRMQQPSWMAYYNSTWLFGTIGRPALAKGFFSVVGTDVESAIWDSDSYCGGYATNVGLEITQQWLSNCSDGFLECSSQSSAGSIWFRDTDRTKDREPLSHGQSRRACFNLDMILRNNI